MTQENTQFDVNFFINFFSAIPEDRWCNNTFADIAGRHCALGHLLPKGVVWPWIGTLDVVLDPQYVAARALFDLFELHLGREPGVVNNGECEYYPQPTPKQRILAALNDIKAKQTPPPPTQSQPVHPCVHLWLEVGVCMLCSATKPAAQPAEVV